jgi:hypothetical protein
MDLTNLRRPGRHAVVHSTVAAVSVLIGFLSMNTSAAYATDCIVIGPRYQLKSDLVNWSMKIGSGQSCIRGLRFNDVAMIESLQLVSPPQIGQVALKGPSFTYSAKSGYEGEDSFTVVVSGTINRSSGSSTIRVNVFVGNPAAAPSLRERSPGPIAAPKPPAALPSMTTLPDNGSLPPCPTWDWSKGSPPPMRPPFDRSKLYCPPPPFKPPSQPLGCLCAG